MSLRDEQAMQYARSLSFECVGCEARFVVVLLAVEAPAAVVDPDFLAVAAGRSSAFSSAASSSSAPPSSPSSPSPAPCSESDRA